MTRVVDITSDFAIAPDRLFEMAADYDELAFICAPLITFTGLPPGQAQVGQVLDLRVSLFGVLPSMPHRIEILRRDEASLILESSEQGAMIRVWRHRIEVEPAPQGASLRDHIEIDAGWLTFAVSAWARYFYRHRHKRRHLRIAQLSSPTAD